MRTLRRLAWFIVVALVLLGFSLLLGWFFKVEAGAPDIEATVRSAAEEYGVDPDFFWCVCLRESNGEQTAIGKAGELGILQWLPESWEYVRHIMGEPEWSWLRLDVNESAKTAAFALSELNLHSWWSTDSLCRHLDIDREP